MTEPCPNMAIIADSKVVATGQPNDLIGELRGQVYRTKTEKVALTQLRASVRVRRGVWMSG